MELSEIRKLVRLMVTAELSELEIDDTNKGLRVHLKREDAAGSPAAGVAPQIVQVVPTPGVAPAAPAAAPPAGTVAPGAPEAGAASGELPPGTEHLKSPMVGTFYRSPSPDAESFVEVGARVEEDSVLCIIEAMKVMNEIKAEMKGEIVEILVENGEPVEFGQPLFLVKKG